jgi:hypothetical protein
MPGGALPPRPLPLGQSSRARAKPAPVDKLPLLEDAHWTLPLAAPGAFLLMIVALGFGGLGDQFFPTLAAAARMIEDFVKSFVIYDISYSPNPASP